jgi:hypothetical protein
MWQIGLWDFSLTGSTILCCLGAIWLIRSAWLTVGRLTAILGSAKIGSFTLFTPQSVNPGPGHPPVRGRRSCGVGHCWWWHRLRRCASAGCSVCGPSRQAEQPCCKRRAVEWPGSYKACTARRVSHLPSTSYRWGTCCERQSGDSGRAIASQREGRRSHKGPTNPEGFAGRGSRSASRRGRRRFQRI